MGFKEEARTGGSCAMSVLSGSKCSFSSEATVLLKVFIRWCKVLLKELPFTTGYNKSREVMLLAKNVNL